MLAFFAFFLLLTVFSLAAQCVGYIAYAHEKALRGNPEEEVPWPTLSDSPVHPEDFPALFTQPQAKHPSPDTFPLDSKRALAVNVPYTLAILQSTQGEELLP